MKYRVRVDFCFDSEADARLLIDYARSLTGKAVSINEGEVNEEISYADIHLCGHDEPSPQPCQSLERVEVRKL